MTRLSTCKSHELVLMNIHIRGWPIRETDRLDVNVEGECLLQADHGYVIITSSRLVFGMDNNIAGSDVTKHSTGSIELSFSSPDGFAVKEKGE